MLDAHLLLTKNNNAFLPFSRAQPLLRSTYSRCWRYPPLPIGAIFYVYCSYLPEMGDFWGSIDLRGEGHLLSCHLFPARLSVVCCHQWTMENSRNFLRLSSFSAGGRYGTQEERSGNRRLNMNLGLFDFGSFSHTGPRHALHNHTAGREEVRAGATQRGEALHVRLGSRCDRDVG